MNYIVYKRVSTQKQGQSGLGLEAQEQAISMFLSSQPEHKIIAEITEVETGTSKRQRPELLKALEMCKQYKAKLIIAKLDRLARNVAFVANLMESKVDFIALDIPNANPFTIHILAAVAEHEAKLISQRTKAALAAAKSNGVKLGSPQNLTKEVRDKGRSIANEKSKNRATERASKIAPSILKMRLEGYTLRGVAAKLNEDKIPTVSGIGSWNASTVRRVINYV